MFGRVLSGLISLGLAMHSAAAHTRASAAPKVNRPEVALKLLRTGQGDELAEAIALLTAQKDLLKKYRAGLKVAADKGESDPEVLSRVLALLKERGDEGCEFIASMVDEKHPGWTSRVVAEYRNLPSCPALRERVMDTLRWLPDPEKSPEGARLVQAVLAIVREDKEQGVGDRLCRHVLSGPEALRREAVDTLLAARPEQASSCLVTAYAQARQSPGNVTMRQYLLSAVAALGGPDAIPTLIFALESFEDRDLACELLKEAEEAAIAGMVFSIRSSDGRVSGVAECLVRIGAPALGPVLALADHPSQNVRQVAAWFLKNYRSKEARKALQGLYHSGEGRLKKAEVFDLLALYPLDEVRDVIEAGLSDPDPEMRIRAIGAIEAAHSLSFSERLLDVAEGDASPIVRRRALDALWRLGDVAAVPLALRQVQYEVPEVVVGAARLLGYLGDEKAVEVLSIALSSKSEDVVTAAKDALWVLTYENLKKTPKYWAAPRPKKLPTGREVLVPGGRATVLGKGSGTLAIVLPGGPGMDFSWARPALDEVADTVAFLSPAPAGEGEQPPPVVSATSVTALLDALKQKRAVLISDGVGGTVALWIAVTIPDAVSGVVAIASPLPQQIDAFDAALIAASPEPFKSFAEAIVKDDQKFHGEALNRYLGRLLAPALAGTLPPVEEVLSVRFDALASGRARAVLARPDVRFAPTELKGRALWIGPLSSLPEEVVSATRHVAETAPDRMEVLDLPKCGFLPLSRCERIVFKAIKKFIKELSH